MPIKSVLHRFQPAPLYVILVLSICYFSIQLVLSHITHALTLLMASYHMLCNIFALAGCIITIKQSNQSTDDNGCGPENCGKILDAIPPAGDVAPKAIVLSLEKSSTAPTEGRGNKNIAHNKKCLNNGESSLSKCERREMKLRNTFGWARIDILAMLIVCIILASLSFSLLVEALQTLVHIDHQDTMHLPIPVMMLGFVGLLLNGLTYLLIGGYTMHQGSFLHVTPSGTVILDRTMSNSVDLALQPEERQLSSAKLAREQRLQDQQLKEQLENDGVQIVSASGAGGVCAIRRQGAAELLRDVSSTIFVIVCGFIVFMAEDEEHTAKFIDPVLSIFSCVLLVSLSYRYMKESCLILLQTIPDCIDMENFESTLVKRFPQIVSYHDLHIWQLAAHKYIATVHIQFQSPKLYIKAIDDVRSYFHDMGINEVTIQPEFLHQKSLPASAFSSAAPSLECLVQCSAPECAEKVCCRDSRTDLREVVSTSPSGGCSGDLNGGNGNGNGGSDGPSDGVIIACDKTKKQQVDGVDSKIASSKSSLIKKLLPHLELSKKIERSKSTNDLVQSTQKITREREQSKAKSLHENSKENIKKTASDACVNHGVCQNTNTPNEQKNSQEVKATDASPC